MYKQVHTKTTREREKNTQTCLWSTLTTLDDHKIPNITNKETSRQALNRRIMLQEFGSKGSYCEPGPTTSDI